jgi:hypothetical protein
MTRPRPLRAAKNHVARNRKKYLVITHTAAAVGGGLVANRVLLANQFFTNPEAFEMLYPSSS